ncbi:MAG TPA: hypothetical protein PLN81_12685 [Bacillota bacterium]|nr:hypothetical protein [Bacillota bacterium]
MQSECVLRTIEEKERDVLFSLAITLKNSLGHFSTSMDRSLGYLDKIIIPIIMASKQNKSYNPLSEIIEKYASQILINKLEKNDYHLLPLSYSSDIMMENKEHIINIDVKTANLNNPSDYQRTVNVGINQTTHPGKLLLEGNPLPDPYYVYPAIPPFYTLPDCTKKLILSYALMFIYPAYKERVDEMRDYYTSLRSLFQSKVRSNLLKILQGKFNLSYVDAVKALDERNRYIAITDSIIRGLFIYQLNKKDIMATLDLNDSDMAEIDDFRSKINQFADYLRALNIKPIAVIAIALPNGLLSGEYLDKIVGGKDYGATTRYHYGDGIFSVIKKETNKEYPRVLFVDVDSNYETQLRKQFGEIHVLDINTKVI